MFQKATKKQSKLRLAIIGISGAGKAQPLTSSILTPSGWIKMAEVEIGAKVINRCGSPVAVTGVYPQGEKDV